MKADESAKWAAAKLIDTIKVPGEYTLEKYTLIKIGNDADESNLYSLNLTIKITGADNKITVCLILEKKQEKKYFTRFNFF